MSISSKALLVNMRISQWIGRRIDKRATSTVETTHLTDSRVGNYTKKLLPGAKELDNIQRLAGAARVFFYSQTLPWCADGSRIISSKNYLDFVNAFRSKKTEFDQAVESFLTQYPMLKEEAKAKLGDLFTENDYPSEMYLRQSFNCDITFMPVPDIGDFRVELSSQERDAFIQSMKDVEKTALQDCYKRLHEVVSKAATKLNDPDAVFRDSLINNIRDICTLMPKLNITDDTQLDGMRIDIEKIINSVSPDAVREIGTTRYNVAKQLSDITSKMSSFMG